MEKLWLEQKNYRKTALIALFFCFILGILTSPYIGGATMSYILFLVGFGLRKTNVKSHARLMKLAMLIDLLLVLILEFTRSATATAFTFKLGTFQQLHILFSTLAVLGYLPLFILGQKFLVGKGTGLQKKWHKNLGLVTFIFRTLGFIFMFFMLDVVK